MEFVSRCLTACLLLGLSAVADAETRGWHFTVLLDDRPIGYHHFDLVETGTARELKSTARFDVKLLFVTVYRYVHDDIEVYDAQCLRRIDAHTDDNGKHFVVTGMQQSQGFVASDGRHSQVLGPCIMTFAYWNPRMLEAQQLLNSQTGKFETVTVAKVADESVQVRGRTEPAAKYVLTGAQLHIELWYSQDMQWLGLQSTTEGGRKLRYRLD